MEEVVQNKAIEVKSNISRRKLFKNGCILLLALGAGVLHYRYVSQLHENYYHFSHLSDLERELTLRTEMGFYYSYYKTIVEERPFLAAISKLMYDRLVEYPKEVNAFNRFNIHPEVLIGALYRYAEPYLNSSGAECHLVDRGPGRAPVTSCTGIQVPIYFYLEAIWVLAGLLLAVLFLYGTTLSGTVLGGVLAVAQYMANHGAATRVQRSPNERENLAGPLLLAQSWLLTLQLADRGRNTRLYLQVSIFIINCLCLLFWQLSQFVFLTQMAILFVMEQLRIIDLKTLCVFLHSHFCGLHMAILLLQGNDMLKSSIYTSFFLVISAYCLFFSAFRIKVKTTQDFFLETWLVMLRICIVICTSFYLKKLISDFLGAEDDNHIFELLLAKFTSYKSFHTLMYTCIDVFDYLPASYFVGVTKTLLLPLALYSSLYYSLAWLSNANADTMKYFHEKHKKLLKQERKDNPGADKERDRKETSKTERDKDTDSDDSGIENNTENVALKDEAKRLDLDKLSQQYKEVEAEEETDSAFIYFMKSLNIDAAVFYSVSQMVVFGAVAVLFMRLKLLLTTQMCVVSALALNASIAFPRRLHPRLTRLVFWAVAAAVVARELHSHVTRELAYKGEFSDYETEELVSWIARSTAAGAVFAGSMPVSAAVLLTTRRAIVSHPHYEHKDARDRAYIVHKVYGRFSAQQLYEDLVRLRATHLIVENRLCGGRTTQGCTLLEMWDAEQPRPAGQLCRALLAQHTDHLYRVYTNRHYAVFLLHDLSVRYMPRVFDT